MNTPVILESSSRKPGKKKNEEEEVSRTNESTGNVINNNAQPPSAGVLSAIHINGNTHKKKNCSNHSTSIEWWFWLCGAALFMIILAGARFTKVTSTVAIWNMSMANVFPLRHCCEKTQDPDEWGDPWPDIGLVPEYIGPNLYNYFHLLLWKIYKYCLNRSIYINIHHRWSCVSYGYSFFTLWKISVLKKKTERRKMEKWWLGRKKWSRNYISSSHGRESKSLSENNDIS